MMSIASKNIIEILSDLHQPPLFKAMFTDLPDKSG